MSTAVDQVLDVLRSRRFCHTNENELQEGIFAAFQAAGLNAWREVQLSGRDRIDFLVDRIGIEVKVAGSASKALRQLERYALSDQIDELVLVTDRIQAGAQPATINGKPLRVLHLLGGLS